jgi:quercetin dioxygenase-like cupin family protein
MRTDRLETMVRGWFVGPFEPAALHTGAAEVAVKRYAAGAREARHVHRIATEVTLIVEGEVRMNGRRFAAGDIVTLEPGEASDFEALAPTLTVVVKVPGVPGDKHPAGAPC